MLTGKSKKQTTPEQGNGEVRPKKTGGRKLSTRISIILLTVIIIIVGGITAFTVGISHKLMMESAQENAQAAAEKNAAAVKNVLERSYSQATILSNIIKSYLQMPEENRESLIRETLTSIMAMEQKNPTGIFGAFAEWEPNQLVSSLPSNSLYYFVEDGEIKYEYTPDDYYNYADENYYQDTKARNEPLISNPYFYDFDTGGGAWMITLTVPIDNEQGEFIGLIGYDILLSTIYEMTEVEQSKYESLYSAMIAPDLQVATCSYDAELMGEAYNEIIESDQKDEILNKIGTNESFTYEAISAVSGKPCIQIYTPVQVSNMQEIWTSCISIDQSEVNKAANRLTFIVISIGLIGLIIIAVLMIVVIRRSVKPVDYIAEASVRMSNGQFDIQVEHVHDDEIGRTADAFNHLILDLRGYIKEISALLQEISEGNLNITSKHEFKGEFTPIKEALDKIIGSLNSMLWEIVDFSDEIISNINVISDMSQSLADGASQQAASIQELTATIGEISDQVKDNKEETQKANDVAKEVKINATGGNEQMMKLLEAMQEIRNSSKDISNIMKTIDDIAFQTNILALNAAVEAARAGSAGKGFAVVADEVRNLANKSAEAADGTGEMVHNVLQTIERGTELAQVTANDLNIITNDVGKLADSLNVIAIGSNEQAEGLSEIADAVKQISEVVQTNSANSQQSAAFGEELAAKAIELKKLIDRFNLTTKQK